MRTNLLLIAGLTALALAGCDDAGERAAAPEAPAEQAGETTGAAGDRARDALGEAGEAARQSVESLGEAGQAGLEALEENAPAIRENIDEAGQRLRNAADALLTDPDPAVDVQGDSAADQDEVPEQLEQPPQ